jgi:ribulose-phosphate 3-epimerase
MNVLNIQVLPSLLAADFGYLADGARKAETAGGDALHIDIMDGHFVPNLSMGPDVVRMARQVVKIPLSVHLMMTNPDRYIERFIDAGADSLLIHVEASCDVEKTLDGIRERGARPGITINPETPVSLLLPLVGHFEEVLFMTVRPGYGGQTFMREVLPKIRAYRQFERDSGTPPLNVIVDGGIDRNTVGDCAAQGANAFVAGTALYKAADMGEEVARLRQNAAGGLVV